MAASPLLSAGESAGLVLALFAAAFALSYAYGRLRTPPAAADKPSLRTTARRAMGTALIGLACLKIAHLSAFAEMFKAYDGFAAALPAYGYVYPFLELGLGIALWTVHRRRLLRAVYAAAIVLLLPSFLGVAAVLWRSWRSGSPLPECGCMGGVFRMRLSHTTLVETSAMLAMASYMLAQPPTPPVSPTPRRP